MKEHKGMIDNRKVSDKHQEGISRVMQRSHEKRDGHNGKMGEHKGKESNFKRSDGCMTPAKA